MTRRPDLPPDAEGSPATQESANGRRSSSRDVLNRYRPSFQAYTHSAFLYLQAREAESATLPGDEQTSIDRAESLKDRQRSLLVAKRQSFATASERRKEDVCDEAKQRRINEAAARRDSEAARSALGGLMDRIRSLASKGYDDLTARGISPPQRRDSLPDAPSVITRYGSPELGIDAMRDKIETSLSDIDVLYAKWENANNRQKVLVRLGALGLAVIAVSTFAVIIHSEHPTPRHSANTVIVSNSVTRGTELEFVSIPAGEFDMGSEKGDPREQPVHHVRITRPFEIGKYEVTQAQWEALMSSNPSWSKGPDLPVAQVSWNDVQGFLTKLNLHRDGHRYRLPTEAQWEYAARAGSRGNDQSNLNSIAWYDQTSNSNPHPVGQKQPNAWGLYDVLGNVMEWCQDWYGDYPAGLVSDPKGPPFGKERVLRGGSCVDGRWWLRVSNRGWGNPDLSAGYFIGFRCVREVK